MKTTYYSFLILIAIAILSCTRSYTFINSKSDQDAARAVTDQFYLNLKNKEYNKLGDLFSLGDRGLSVNQKNEEIRSKMEKMALRVGTVDSVKPISCETKRIEGSRPSGEYKLSYIVVRSSRIFKDSFRLILEGDKIHIADYDMAPL